MDVRKQLRRAAAHFSKNDAIVHGDRRLSFAEAWSRGCRLANALGDLGLLPGDRIATLEKNSVEAADILLAAVIGNFVRVPLYARNARESHAQMICNTGSRFAIVDENLLGEIAGLEDELPDFERVIVRDENYESWLASASDQDPDPNIDSNDYLVIRHTGGTTGKAKGVAYRHLAWINICRAFFAEMPPILPGDAVAHVGPLSHASGFLFTPAWYGGGRNVMIDAFNPEAFLELLEREEITHAFTAPTMLNAIANLESAYGRKFPKLKALMSASAPISENTVKKAREIFGENVLYSGYGQTEILPIAAMSPREWFGNTEGSAPIRSVGRALPFIDLEIRDDDGNPVGPGQSGEIVARFEHGQMDGFWNDPEETAKRVVDGWVKTGDVGMLDANGFLYLLDRSNDMIISGGFNIYPNEIENVIASHPKVKDVSVFGIPDERWGETPLAMVVVAPDTDISDGEIIDLVSKELGSMKKPGKVVFTTDPLPLSNVGKVLRSKLREPYWAGKNSRVSGS